MYIIQPILELVHGDLFAYELLYRGGGKPSWIEQDKEMLRNHIIASSNSLCINLTSTSILSSDASLILAASKKCPLIVEWNEEWVNEEVAYQAANILQSWRNRFGIKIALDDAGAGHDFIKRFFLVNPDIVKIDGTMIVSARTSYHMKKACEAIATLTHDNNKTLVAEWIENETDLKFAKYSLGAEYGQGFYLDDIHPNKTISTPDIFNEDNCF